MSWEKRLKEMLLAGGALATAGCSSSAASSSRDAAAAEPSDATADTAVEAPTGVGFCCNADPDPCYGFLACDAALTTECAQEMSCMAEGGTWNYNLNNSTGDCSFAGAPGDAAASAEGGDAGADVDAPD